MWPISKWSINESSRQKHPIPILMHVILHIHNNQTSVLLSLKVGQAVQCKKGAIICHKEMKLLASLNYTNEENCSCYHTIDTIYLADASFGQIRFLVYCTVRPTM